MEYLLIGFLAGIIICGAYYQFFLKNKQDENKSDDTEIKIELARKEEELKGVVKAKDDLQEQLDEKKAEVTELYKVVDGINEYKTQTQKAINKHDEAVARHTNWWEKLTTNITYQGLHLCLYCHQCHKLSVFFEEKNLYLLQDLH